MNNNQDIWANVKAPRRSAPTNVRSVCHKLIIPNDILTEKLFALTPPQREALDNGERGYIVEYKARKKQPEIRTTFTMRAPVGILTQFHRAVLSVVMSHLNVGHEEISPDMIYRSLTGKQNTATAIFPATAAQKKAIDDAMYTLSHTRIDVDMSDLVDSVKTNITTPKFNRLLLKARRKKGFGSSDKCVAYVIEETSPLLEVARDKRQNLACDMSLLNVPNIHNTPAAIGVKFYVLQRVLETLAHPKSTTPLITFDDVFDKCQLEGTPLANKKNLKSLVHRIVQTLEERGIVPCCSVAFNETFVRKVDEYGILFGEIESKKSVGKSKIICPSGFVKQARCAL